MFAEGCWNSQDTITAIATPPGRGAIAVVRISGEKTRSILDEIFRPVSPSHKLANHRVYYGRLVDDASGEVIDQVMVSYFQAPRSYTGQDMGEISCHGSPVLACEILELVLRHRARLAEPGEFTLRAYINGKMDLTQAEAVADLVNASTRQQAHLAIEQLQGVISRAIRPIKEELLEVITTLETAVEFPEELTGAAPTPTSLGKLESISRKLDTLAKGFRFGQLVREGFSLVITGRPNVGKSSLFNRLLGQDRAIVTEIPGTTRDLIREQANIGGIPITFTDTAGFYKPVDPIEKIGVEKSQTALAEADIVLHVLDASKEWFAEEAVFMSSIPPTGLVIALNKSDLAVKITPELAAEKVPTAPVILVSAKTGAGIDLLKKHVLAVLAPEGSSGDSNSAVVSNIRQQHCILSAIEEIGRSVTAGEGGGSDEFILFHLRRALHHLDALTGETTVDDILGKIFSTFCVGK